MQKVLKIGTRASQLALTQSEWVRERILKLMPDTAVELVRISTKGDRVLDAPLAKVGGKGLFVKEIEEALLRGEIDLAVHSMKDVPSELPAGCLIDAMLPRADERRGFILFRKDGETRTLVPANGVLRMPTGMAVKDGRLFVCDAERLAVFDLKRPEDAPQIVAFAPDDEVLNALALDGDVLHVSVTGTDRIYALDVSDPANMDKVRPRLWLSLPGPNGMALGEGVLYVVSSPHDYANPTADNVIYRVTELDAPRAEKLPGGKPGVYDGAALSDDGKTLYVSEWRSASVRAVDIATGKTRTIYEEPGIGPADIAQQGGSLHIPDLVGGRVITLRLGE